MRKINKILSLALSLLMLVTIVGMDISTMQVQAEENIKIEEENSQVIDDSQTYFINKEKMDPPVDPDTTIPDAPKPVIVKYYSSMATGIMDTTNHEIGDIIILKDNEFVVPVGLMFIGWSDWRSNDLVIGVGDIKPVLKTSIEPTSHGLFEFSAVWATDANGNGIPDVDEVMLEIFLTTSSVNGTITNWVLKGDVNRDGIVNQDDADAIGKHLSGADPLTDPKILEVGDVDGDGRLTANDAIWIYRVATGLVTVPQSMFTLSVINTPNANHEVAAITVNGMNLTVPAKGTSVTTGAYTVTVDANGIATVEGIVQDYMNEIVFGHKIIQLVITPTPTPEAGRTCQDDGYPNDYYWNGTACVIDAVTPPIVNENKPVNPNQPNQPIENPKVEDGKVITPVIDTVTETPEVTLPEATIPEAEENIEVILPITTPLAGSGGWSVLNVILTGIAALFTIVSLLLRKRKEETEIDENSECVYLYKRNNIYSILMLVTTIGLGIFLIMTHDFTLDRILINQWTPLFIIVTIFATSLFILSLKWKQIIE